MITNKPGRTDYLLSVNFILFALYPLLSGSLQRLANPHNLLVVGVLALSGAVAAFATAIIELLVFNVDRAFGYESNAIRFGTVALLLGFLAPMGARLEYLGDQEATFLRAISSGVVALSAGENAREVLNRAQRVVGTDCRPTEQELAQIAAEAA